MPYIIPSQREFIEADASPIITIGQSLRAVALPNKDTLVLECLSFILSHHYPSPLFHAQTYSLHPLLLTSLQSFNDRIDQLKTDNPQSLEGLLNYSFTRFFVESYPVPRYRDFNAIAGILKVLEHRSSGEHIPLQGLLSCCQQEYYRIFTGPYEDLKIQENGPVALSTDHATSSLY